MNPMQSDLYQQLFELSEDAILLLEEDRIIKCNPASLKILRAESEERLLASHPSEFSPPLQENGENSWEKASYYIHKCYTEGTQRFDWIHRRFTGEDFPAEVTLTPLQNQGKPSIFAVIRDISVWMKSELARKDAEKKLKFIADNSEDIIWMRDLKFRYTYLSPSVYRVKGFTVEEALKLSATQTVYREDLKNAISILKDELEKDSQPDVDIHRSRRFKMREYKKDGSLIWTEQSLSFIRDINNQPIGFLGITRDISDQVELIEDLKKAKIQAEESDRLKSSFLANMSHEIRTPLNAILGFSELLTDGQADPEEKELFTGIIRKSSNQLLTIISDIFDISRLETKQLVLEKKPNNLSRVLNGFRNYKNSLDPDLAGCCELQLTPIPEYLDQDFFCDKDRIIQVVNNLLNNAFKFSMKGEILLKVILMSPKKLRIEVIDHGPGIAKEIQPLIFQRFRQGHESLDRQFGGTGLGLAICKGIIDLMGGEIGVQSKIDQGSKFWFTLPLEPLD